MTRKLKNALQTQKKLTQKAELQIQGTLGIPLNGAKLVEVPGRNSFVYVRLRDNQNEVIQAFNNKVAASYGLPVFLKRQNNRYEVLGVNTARYQSNWNSYAPYLPKHGTSHSFANGGGGDVTWIFDRQFMPLLVYPSAQSTGTNVTVSAYPLLYNNAWKMVGGTGTDSFIGYAPTGGNDAIMALVYLDAPTGNPRLLINSGTPFSNLLTGTNDIYSHIPVPTDLSTQIPLAGVRIITGTSTIGWDNLYGVRQFVHPIPTGTGGGGSTTGTFDNIGIYGLDDGVPLGTGTWVNFGNNLTATISGTTIRIDATGGSSFSGIPIYKDGQFIATGTSIDFEQNLYVGVTGTTIFVRAPITTYFRVGQPTTLSNPTGLYWIVPDRVYASGSLGIFNNGHALIPGIDYIEQLWVSGTYQYLYAQPTGTYHLAHYGVPCSPQTQPSTGTTVGGLTDSEGVLMVDSNGVQIVDSNGN